MSKMAKDYDDILNLDYDRQNRIPYAEAESLIYTDFRQAESLDGTWNFKPDVYRTVTRKKYYAPAGRDAQGRELPMDVDIAHMDPIQVPGSWNTAAREYWYYEGEGVYSRTFSWESGGEDERVFLRIGAANYECRIWLNGRLAARHRGGFTPFCVEVTDYLQKENVLVITVNNRREMDQIPSMTYDWFNYGGISRSVELFRVPKVFIKRFEAGLVPDGTFEKIRVSVRLSDPLAGQVCRFSIEELNAEAEAVTDSQGRAEVVIQARPELWSCQNPKLYQVKASCGQDQAEDQVGFREIRVKGKEIFLNGEKIFLKGICCHEESSQGGRITTDQERQQILDDARELGCNVLRLTHYPHSERMSRLADQAGILLWEEVPVYWALEFSNEDTYRNAQNQLRELIIRDKNRASVIIWSVGNENPDTQERLDFMKNLADVCHEMDDTRLVSAACLVDVDTLQVKDRLAQYVDVVAFNEYYGWYYRDYEGLQQILENTKIDKPLVITETGAGAMAGCFGDEEELFTEEHQEKVYRKQIQYSDGKIQGLFPWLLYDFFSPIRMHPCQDGQNRKGLITSDKKRRKKAFYVLQEYYKGKQV